MDTEVNLNKYPQINKTVMKKSESKLNAIEVKTLILLGKDVKKETYTSLVSSLKYHIKKHGLSDVYQLFKKLMEAEAKVKKEQQKRKKEQIKENEYQVVLKQFLSTLDYNVDVVHPASAKEVRNSIDRQVYNKHTKRLRDYYLKHKMLLFVQYFFRRTFRRGSNSNTIVCNYAENNSIEVNAVTDWNMYAKSYGHPGYIYRFEVKIIKGYSLKVEAGKLIFFETNKASSGSFRCTYFTQGRGFNVNNVEGYIVNSKFIRTPNERSKKIVELLGASL